MAGNAKEKDFLFNISSVYPAYIVKKVVHLYRQ